MRREYDMVTRAGIQMFTVIPDTHGSVNALTPKLYKLYDKIAATATESMPSVGMER